MWAFVLDFLILLFSYFYNDSDILFFIIGIRNSLQFTETQIDKTAAFEIETVDKFSIIMYM